MIEVRNLHKYYGPHAAVRDVSFDVHAGEIVGFLGPNGAGKTTTLRILTCYMPASAGSVRVGGHDVLTASMKVRQIVGYLPESVPLYHELRVREYLRFRGKLHGLGRAAREAAIARVAERCWLTDVLHRPIGHLSKGYRQRVGLADALLHNPKVLVLDEPTVGLDPRQIRETRSLIQELALDHTVILSSHILPEVEATCRRLIIIHRGQLVAQGTPTELRERVSGDAALIAELRGPREAIVAAVRQVAGVKDVQAGEHDGWTQLRLHTSADVRAEIAQLTAKQGWPLRELRRDIASLEDFFVRIVTGTRDVAPPPVEPVAASA